MTSDDDCDRHKKYPGMGMIICPTCKKTCYFPSEKQTIRYHSCSRCRKKSDKPKRKSRRNPFDKKRITAKQKQKIREQRRLSNGQSTENSQHEESSNTSITRTYRKITRVLQIELAKKNDKVKINQKHSQK